MKINTFSQNKLSFGVRKPFNDELKIDTLRKTPYPYIPDNRVHDLLFEKIMSAKGTQSLRRLFNNIKIGHVSNELKEGVNYYPTNQPPLNYVRPNWENLGINHVPQNIQTETNAIDQRTIAPVPQEFVQPLPFNMVPQGVNYYPTNQPPLNYVRPNWENLEINYVPQNIQTETNATGEIERDPYEVTLNNQWNEDGNFDSFKSSGDNDQELLDLLCPQSSDADDPGLTGDDLFDSLVIEEHGMFSRIPSLPSLDDLGLSGNNLVGSQVLEEHGKFSDRFNLPNLEDFEFGLNSSQLPDTNSFANDNKLNLSRPHESYDDAYSDKRRKM